MELISKNMSSMFLRKYVELPKNLFGLLYWNIFSIYLLIFIFVGLLSLFGVKPIEFNGEPTYGILGLIASLLMAPFIALVTTFATWLLLKVGNFILRLFARGNQ
jgi:hypothetical protein